MDRKEALLAVEAARETLCAAENHYKEVIASLPKVERAIAVIEDKGFPVSGGLYPSRGMDSADEYVTFEDGLRIAAIYDYGYTDIEGLSEEEFDKVCQHLRPSSTED